MIERESGADDLVIGGFVIVVPAAPPSAPGSGLPDRILTVSHCLMDAPEHDYFGWFTDGDEAEIRRGGAADARTVTVVIPRDEAERLVREYGGPMMPYFDLLRRGDPVPDGTALLGYEVVGVESSLSFHSWHCHDYAAEVRVALGVTVNGHGLIDDRADAVRVRDWMLARSPREQPAPVPWVVVALAEHLGDVAASEVPARTTGSHLTTQ